MEARPERGGREGQKYDVRQNTCPRIHHKYEYVTFVCALPWGKAMGAGRQKASTASCVFHCQRDHEQTNGSRSCTRIEIATSMASSERYTGEDKVSTRETRPLCVCTGALGQFARAALAGGCLLLPMKGNEALSLSLSRMARALSTPDNGE